MKRKLIELWTRGKIPKPVILGSGVLLAAGAGLLLNIALWPETRGLAANGETALVRRGPLTISVTESGTIRPRQQVVLKNELDDPATILFVAPEGSIVKKGELVVELDTTQVETELVERRIRVQNDEAELVHAQENLKVVENQAQADEEQALLTLKFAEQDLEKYVEGEYPKLVKEAKARITLAREELTQAEETLKWSQILYDEKYLSQTELKQDELAFKKAKLNVELAESELELLQKYTYQRQIDQLKSDVRQAKLALERTRRLAAANLAQARASLSSREAELKEETDRLKDLEHELELAKIYAPIEGMVIYASSVRNRWRRNEEPIRTGTVVDERDDIIYLPTASEYDAAIKIPEVALNKVRPGMPVRLTVDALPKYRISGTVKSIAQLADAESRYLNPNLKLYETIIAIDSTEAPLRNGMSCRAEVIIEQYDDVVYIPLQALAWHQGAPAVYVVGEDGMALPRPVEPGLDNARFVHIRSGLKEGERVLLTPPLTESKAIPAVEETEEAPPEKEEDERAPSGPEDNT